MPNHTQNTHNTLFWHGKDVLRPYSSRKFVWADVQWLWAPFLMFLSSGSAWQSRQDSWTLSTPIHLRHSPEPHPIGWRQRRRRRAARRKGSSPGQCGGSSWHLKVTFQNANVVLRSQTSQGQVSGWALISSATTPKSVKIPHWATRRTRERSHKAICKTRLSSSPVRTSAPVWNAHNIKQLRSERNAISGDTSDRFSSTK